MLLTVRDLKKSFRDPEGGVLPVVEVPSFEVAEGEQVGLRGTSGSGKTTFLHLLAGILGPDGGTISIGGEVVTSFTDARRDRHRAEHIGYVYQSFHLLTGYTALENVLLGMMFGPGPDRNRATELLSDLGLADRVNHKPRELSIGQQQRVSLARALAHRPKLILADEPTGNLDPKHAGQAMEQIRSRCSEVGAALLLVSHDPQLLQGFDRVEEWTQVNRAFASGEEAECAD